MKKSFVLVLVTALALCASQVCQGQAHKNVKETEANRLAREGAEAATNQDWDKAVELLHKATAMDHMYADELATVYQQRGYGVAEIQQLEDAGRVVTEGLKIELNNTGIYE